VDQNLFMALVAPRGLMLSSSRRESDGNPWGIEQAYDSTLKVYKFLGAPLSHVSMRLRDGDHGTSARDIEDYVDFFDHIFGRSDHTPPNEQLYGYSFEQWSRLSKENINPFDYPVRKDKDLLTDSDGKKILSVNEWDNKKTQTQKTLRWILGDEPPKATNQGPLDFKNSENLGEAYYGTLINRPEATEQMGRLNLSPGHSKPGFGDYLYGYLYYPKRLEEKMKNGTAKLPVIIYLHKYDYSQGFFDTQQFDHDKLPFIKALVKQGYAVFMYDMMGFGNRKEEGTRFYQRNPHWSKMGKFVTDLRGAVDALENLNFIDSAKISVLGYSLGATVGLYGAALDKRIASVVSVCGFTPMRTDTQGKGTEGIKAYSHLHGLLPRLGFFVGHENRIPYDFNEILAAVAPRPLLVIAPALDEDATVQDVRSCVTEAKDVFQLYGVSKNIQLDTPSDYNRFSEVMQKKVLQWFKNKYGQ
ncbi:MAG: alpha/beta fold hydrolase, partial [Ginsengibacter sp.]